MTNTHHTVLYTSVASQLYNRILQHQNNEFPVSFTAKYNCVKLVYYQGFDAIEEAIAMERKMKNWKREWKVQLIEELNTEWNDLSEKAISLD